MKPTNNTNWQVHIY